jgi:predicted RNA-binding Zn ribbon-like protein
MVRAGYTERVAPAKPGPAHTFEFTGGDLCLDFVNTVSHRTDAERRSDGLVSFGDLLEWSRQAGTISATDHAVLKRAADRSPVAARRALARAVALREAIYTAMSAYCAGRSIPRSAIDTISREAAIATSHRQIVTIAGSGSGFAWSWDATNARVDRAIWPVAWSAADLVTSPRVNQVRECALETCGWLFVDTSRNRTRRWCDMRVCGNRAKVRRFYQRQRSEP